MDVSIPSVNPALKSPTPLAPFVCVLSNSKVETQGSFDSKSQNSEVTSYDSQVAILIRVQYKLFQLSLPELQVPKLNICSPPKVPVFQV